jgi:hypothetical protein
MVTFLLKSNGDITHKFIGSEKLDKITDDDGDAIEAASLL